ncbi:MAG TPA: 2-C-methyl-D-erythritol 4-phosphate cytidylyltransferase [Nitrospirae bacterium]|nr:2-C-methyl-D-erythritol 4-phosphate cytidylyltransferase [bacterium BMS3Bbin09]HDN94587.1 2-C-methyl-D-erythritol 4-phosphate cytidylyltransferase [Nitrospirota bacterium]HDO67597.1 2-C-methyl-D-erythritol 4-phosphate cytidylyltransferase [Nitrospirota bacterium]HEW81771.1 2-C-methyl-D-erythritol 4-phosphate cytidylyltransferase [Nitrospirota bacterium]
MKKRIVAIVPAAGLGKRFSSSVRKTFATLDGMPLLTHTLKRLNREPLITDIIPVLRGQDTKTGLDIAEEHKLDKVRWIAAGGPERQDSIYNGLRLLEEMGGGVSPDTLILVHDGARPVIPKGTIHRLISEVEGIDGAAPGVPANETLKSVNKDGIITSTIDRENIRAIQTPQIFRFSVLKKAYEKAFADGFYGTDDASLVERIGGKIKIIPGNPLNIKVTTPEDLHLVEYIIANQEV